MRLVRAEDGIIAQEMLNEVILCDLETLPIIQSGQNIWTVLVDGGSLISLKRLKLLVDLT
jgi:hypothetical protein